MCQALFVEAKLDASKELGDHIDQLNVFLDERRKVFENARKGPLSLYYQASLLGGIALTQASRPTPIATHFYPAWSVCLSVVSLWRVTFMHPA